MPKETEVVETGAEVVEEKTETVEEKTINSDSSTEEILESRKEADPKEESPTSKQAADTSGEDGKTQTDGKEKSEEVEEEEDTEPIEGKDGEKIPIPRLNKVINQRNELRQETKDKDTQLEEYEEALSDPDVLRVVWKKQGKSDEQIVKELKDRGFEGKPGEKVKTTEHDLSTVKGWDAKIASAIEQAIEKRIGPIDKKLTDTETKTQEREFSERMSSEKTDAEKVSKEFELEYGDEKKDIDNINSGVGKINAYLIKYPKKLEAIGNGLLTKSDILRLALAEKGLKLGVQKGVKKEKDRQEGLKQTAMEGGGDKAGEEVPNSNWSTDKILEWKEKHPDAQL